MKTPSSRAPLRPSWRSTLPARPVPIATLLVAVALALNGCEDSPTLPSRTDPVVLPDTRPLASAILPAGAVVAGYSIPVPESNTWIYGMEMPDNGRVPLHSIGAVVPHPMWALIRVQGMISLTTNPEYEAVECSRRPSSCPPPRAGKSFGPEANTGIEVKVAAPGGTVMRSAGADAVEGIAWITPGTDIQVSRAGYGEGYKCDFFWCQPTRFIGAYLASGRQTITVTAMEPPMEIRVEDTVVAGTDSVLFTAVEKYPTHKLLAPAWVYIPGDTAAHPEWVHRMDAHTAEFHYWLQRNSIRHCDRKPACKYIPPADGRMYLYTGLLADRGDMTFAQSGGLIISPVMRVEGKKEVRIVEVSLPLPDSSFTTLAGENKIRLRAEVSDPAWASRVQWKVVDDPADRVTSPPVSAPAGLSTTATIGRVSNPVGRWPGEHPGPMDRKALRYQVRAFHVTSNGDTTWSAPVTLRQHETDVIRQEYVDYGKKVVPRRGDFGIYRTTNFSERELNPGDYPVFLSTPAQRERVEVIRRMAKEYLEEAGYSFKGLTLNSGFRNPVHHHKHEKAKSLESEHLYGNAVDVRIWNLGPTRKEMFDQFRWIAKHEDVDACYEPEKVVRDAGNGELTHAHFDWREERPCPKTW